MALVMWRSTGKSKSRIRIKKNYLCNDLQRVAQPTHPAPQALKSLFDWRV